MSRGGKRRGGHETARLPAHRSTNRRAAGRRKGRPVPVAPLAGAAARACRLCACTDLYGCLEGCSWVEADLCSACVRELAPKRYRELVQAAVDKLTSLHDWPDRRELADEMKPAIRALLAEVGIRSASRRRRSR